jgi:hypothetical protein
VTADREVLRRAWSYFCHLHAAGLCRPKRHRGEARVELHARIGRRACRLDARRHVRHRRRCDIAQMLVIWHHKKNWNLHVFLPILLDWRVSQKPEAFNRSG